MHVIKVYIIWRLFPVTRLIILSHVDYNCILSYFNGFQTTIGTKNNRIIFSNYIKSMTVFSCSNDDHLLQQTGMTRHFIFGVYSPSRVVQLSMVVNIYNQYNLNIFTNLSDTTTTTTVVQEQETFGEKNYSTIIYNFSISKTAGLKQKKVTTKSLSMNVLRNNKKIKLFAKYRVTLCLKYVFERGLTKDNRCVLIIQ